MYAKLVHGLVFRNALDVLLHLRLVRLRTSRISSTNTVTASARITDTVHALIALTHARQVTWRSLYVILT